MKTSRQLVIAVALGLFGLQFTSQAFAIPTPMRVVPERFSKAILAGAMTGGAAADEFSLLAVKSKVTGVSERIYISYGTPEGKPLHSSPGFFNLEFDRHSRRIVIDLAQISRTAIDPLQMQKSLSQSKYVASSEMTMDPQDGSTNIILNLKAPAALAVATQGKTGQIILDFRPVAVAPEVSARSAK